MSLKADDHYRELLLQTADVMREYASSIEDQTCQPTGGQADGGLSNTPMHLADIGTDVNIQEVSSVLLDNERYLLEEIQGALKRLVQGTFGVCESCGKPVGEQRLEAIPYARNCVRCAARAEQESDSFEDFSATPDTTNLDASFEIDTHAAGTAGGGTAVGGLAGTNIGHGDPRGVGELDRATSSSKFDADERFDGQDGEPQANRSGAAIAGTPATKRAKSAKKPASAPQASRSTEDRRRSPRRE